MNIILRIIQFILITSTEIYTCFNKATRLMALYEMKPRPTIYFRRHAATC